LRIPLEHAVCIIFYSRFQKLSQNQLAQYTSFNSYQDFNEIIKSITNILMVFSVDEILHVLKNPEILYEEFCRALVKIDEINNTIYENKSMDNTIDNSIDNSIDNTIDNTIDNSVESIVSIVSV